MLCIPNYGIYPVCMHSRGRVIGKFSLISIKLDCSSLMVSKINYIFEMSKKGVLGSSMSHLVLEIFRNKILISISLLKNKMI